MHSDILMCPYSLLLTTQSPHMPVRGIMNNLHHDILTGNDELLETRDLFLGGEYSTRTSCNLV